MTLSQMYQRILGTIQLAQNQNLSNIELVTLTTHLYNQLLKMRSSILTKSDEKSIKNKAMFMASTQKLMALYAWQAESTKGAWRYFSSLSVYSNVLNRYFPRSRHAKKRLLTELIRFFEGDVSRYYDNDCGIIVFPEQGDVDYVPLIKNLRIQIKLRRITQLMIPFRLTLDYTDIITLLTKQKIESLVFEVTTPEETRAAAAYIHGLGALPFTMGLSINILSPTSVFCVKSILETLSTEQKRQFIFRFHKSPLGCSSKKSFCVVRTNAQYKWRLYTCLQLIKKHPVRVMINCNNLYDLAWVSIMRAQLHLEKTIVFEGNISKHPDVTKSMCMIHTGVVQSRFMFLDQANPDHMIPFILKSMIHQSVIFGCYQKAGDRLLGVLESAHRLFFRYLDRNFLTYYLSRFSL